MLTTTTLARLLPLTRLLLEEDSDLDDDDKDELNVVAVAVELLWLFWWSLSLSLPPLLFLLSDLARSDKLRLISDSSPMECLC